MIMYGESQFKTYTSKAVPAWMYADNYKALIKTDKKQVLPNLFKKRS